MYLLDTNVVSELRKHKPHGGVIAWLNSVGDDVIFLSAVTMGDAMLAATALIHRLTVVTRNTRDFEPFRVPLFNPFNREMSVRQGWRPLEGSFATAGPPIFPLR